MSEFYENKNKIYIRTSGHSVVPAIYSPGSGSGYSGLGQVAQAGVAGLTSLAFLIGVPVALWWMVKQAAGKKK